MKKTIFVLTCGAMIFCSCGENGSLQSSEMDFDELTQQYDKAQGDVKFGKEGDDISPKVETRENTSIIEKSSREYVTELMNRTSTAKEKVMRSVYSTPGSVVGVFKVGSCGNYKELTVKLDCEDSREASSITGNVGDSNVDSNGNVEMKFCLTESNRFYPGGVLLVDHINYRPYATGTMSILVRHHDTEDSSGDNTVSGGNDRYYSRETISNGHTKVSQGDAILAWAFPCTGSYYYPLPPIGPSGIQYGLLVMEQASTGQIFCDDEDKRNQNWAKEYNGYDYKQDLNGYVNQYGVTLDGNTTYRVGVSTDRAKFYDKNAYYALVR